MFSMEGETCVVHNDDVQGSSNRRALGLVNFVLAVAYYF